MIIGTDGKRLTPKGAAREIVAGFLSEGDAGDYGEHFLNALGPGCVVTDREARLIMAQVEKILVRLYGLLR